MGFLQQLLCTTISSINCHQCSLTLSIAHSFRVERQTPDCRMVVNDSVNFFGVSQMSGATRAT